MNSISKITLSASRDIPFNKLRLSQDNVRRVKAGISIEELAEDIVRRGLLQGLNVRPVLDADGAETGHYDIPAGGRRYQALALLVKQKRLSKTAPVPCVVRDPATDILAEDDSLAENIQRAPLHPLDQYNAFKILRDKGMSEEEIAAAFFVAPQIVKQRLRLISVSPVLLDRYANDEMTLEQLMAFTVSSDHQRQEQIWDSLSTYSRHPHQIRRFLTEGAVNASDKRARFVGIDAYEAAGGAVEHDLFEQDEGGWLQDSALLDRLALEKLQALGEEIGAEGWKWIEIAITQPYDIGRLCRRLTGVPRPMSEAEEKECAALHERLEEASISLEAFYQEADQNNDDETLNERIEKQEEQCDSLKNRIQALEIRPMDFAPDEIARAGVFLGLDANGDLQIRRGYVRPEDEAAIEEDGKTNDAYSVDPEKFLADHVAVVHVGGKPESEQDSEEEDVIRPIPERLRMELSAFLTLALRDGLASNPHVALTTLLHKLVIDSFYDRPIYGSCLGINVHRPSFTVQPVDLAESIPAKLEVERHEEWRNDIPQNDEQALWDWIDALDDARRLALLAHCISPGVNALYEKVNPYGGGLSQRGLERRLSEAKRLACAAGMDLVEASGWRPTISNYLGRVPKARILEAVRDGAGEQAAEMIAHFKKDDMAREAERLLADSGWLPEPLRLIEEKPLETLAECEEPEALPDFLSSEQPEPDAVLPDETGIAA